MPNPSTNNTGVARSPVATDFFRQREVYTSWNASKGALIEEAKRVFGEYFSGLSIEELRARVLEGSVFSKRTIENRRAIWGRLYKRYFSSQQEWVLNDFRLAYSLSPDSPEFIALLYLHFALRDGLTFDFVTKTLWDHWKTKLLRVTSDDVLNLLDTAVKSQPQIQRWSQATRTRLARNTLAALRDFGALSGIRSKSLVRPVLPNSTAEHLLHLLASEGLRGREILSDSSWRLFLSSESDVAGQLSLLAQNRRISFERTGNVIVLGFPDDWEISNE